MLPPPPERRTPAVPRSVNPTKLRADLERCVLDGKINISDITHALIAFHGLPYPLTPTSTPCEPWKMCDPSFQPGRTMG